MRAIVLSIVLISVINVCDAQYNPPPTKSRFYNSKHSTFQIKQGDILVYSFNRITGEEQEVVVKVSKFGDGLSYNYEMNGIAKGTVNITNNDFSSASKYSYDFTGEKIPGDKNTLWLSKKNWRDIASKDKMTTMDIGNGAETFVREDASTLKIKYKGKEKIFTVYNITNNSNVDKKAFTVLTDEKNPLITSMNFGWTMTLKEVR